MKKILANGYRDRAVVAILLAVFFLEASAIAWKKSNTWDEPAHILAGYAHLKEGMDYLSPLNHPAFGRAVQAIIPAVFLHLDFDPSVRPEEAEGSDFYPYALKFLYENRVGAERLLFLCRLSNIVLAGLLGLTVFFWSKELWGATGGVLSLFLYCLSPNILAHSSLATTDMPITAFFFISIYCLYSIVERGFTYRRGLGAAVALSFALTSKHTAILLIPLFIAGFLIRAHSDRSKKTAAGLLSVFLATYLIIWAVYGFRYHSGGAHYEPLYWARFSGSSFAPLFGLLRRIRFLPEAYLYGIAGVLSGAGAGKPAFLMGAYSTTGWRSYFITAFLIKTPIPTIILLAASVLYLLKDRARLPKALYLVVPAVIIFAAMSMQKVNIGLRHVLPAYPFIFVLIGYAPAITTRSVRAARYVLFACIAWYLYANVAIFPHQLAYFNEFTGGPRNGYKYLVDSNLDWGQDLNGLKKYMDENKIERINLAYFGMSDPRYFGIEYDYLPSFVIMNPRNVRAEVPLKGWFAISATMLQGVYLRDRDFYRVFRETAPVDSIGYSIFIYRF
ncbi:MAG: glycosyltransferase family 39 protein [Deltaproteobacteria bacterium]|nr:glycosyltransferase family 39 protein [Deltaproteobacteria bacterium]